MTPSWDVSSLWSLAAPHNRLPEAGMVETTSLWLWRGDERAATARSLLIPFFPQGFPQIQLGEKMGAPLRLSLSSAAAAEASFRTSHPHFSVWIFLLQLPANSLPGTALVCCLLPRNSPNLSGFVLQTGDKKMSLLRAELGMGPALGFLQERGPQGWGRRGWGEEVRVHSDHGGYFTSCRGQSAAFLL